MTQALQPSAEQFTAFHENQRIAAGDQQSVALALAMTRTAQSTSVIVISDLTGRHLDFDLRGDLSDVATRYAPSPPTEPEKPARGRPRLGVVPREVTLLARHWEWLAGQPGGASAALRRLVEQARNDSGPADQRRAAQDAAYRIMTTLAGNLPDFEEALRAFYANDQAAFLSRTETWPIDVRDYVRDRVAAVGPPSGVG